MSSFDFNKTRNIGDIIVDTFAYIRIHFNTLGKSILFFAFPFYILGISLSQEAASLSFDTILNSVDPISTVNEIFGFRYFLGVTLSWIGSLVIIVVPIKHIQLVRDGIEPTLGNMAYELPKQALGVWGLAIIISFASGIALLLFIIPGIFVYTKLSLANSAYLIDKDQVSDGLGTSWEITKDYWWTTFLIVVVMYILVFFAATIISIPASIGTLFLGESGVLQESGNISSVFLAFSYLLNALGATFYIIMHIALSLHYLNLKERKEGGGLRAQIDALGHE